MLQLEGFDESFMGIVRQFNTEFALYDYEKVIEKLMKDMNREDAEEYFEYNIVGGWHGEQTPGFYYSRYPDVQK